MARRKPRSLRDVSEARLFAILDLLAGAAEPQVIRTFRQSLDRTLAASDRRQLVVAFQYGDASLGAKAVPWVELEIDLGAMFPGPGDLADQERAARPYARLVTEASDVGVRMLPPEAARNLDPKVAAERALDVAREHARRRVRNISQETERGLRGLIETSYRRGITPAEVEAEVASRLFADGSAGFGLDERSARALGRRERALRESDLSPREAERQIRALRQRALERRSQLIAHTETHQAAVEGTRAAWEAAVEDGQLKPAEWEREWVARMVNTCNRCAAFDGARAPMVGGYFTATNPSHHPGVEATGETSPGPEIHPDGYCIERLVPLEAT